MLLRKVINRLSKLMKSERSRRKIQQSKKKLFELKLRALLDRPEPTEFFCPCCTATLAVKEIKRVSAVCYFTGFELNRVVCPECGLIFGPLPLIECLPNELTELYELLYQFYQEGDTRASQEKTFYLLNPSHNGRYLNYACGDWSLGINRLRDLKWRIWGFEPFMNATPNDSIIRRRELLDSPYDGMMTNNYIEHVQNPLEFFMMCKALIGPHGVMAHASTCYGYRIEHSPFHLYFYSEESIKRIAHRADLEIQWSGSTDLENIDSVYGCYVFQRTD